MAIKWAVSVSLLSVNFGQIFQAGYEDWANILNPPSWKGLQVPLCPIYTVDMLTINRFGEHTTGPPIPKFPNVWRCHDLYQPYSAKLKARFYPLSRSFAPTANLGETFWPPTICKKPSGESIHQDVAILYRISSWITFNMELGMGKGPLGGFIATAVTVIHIA